MSVEQPTLSDFADDDLEQGPDGEDVNAQVDNGSWYDSTKAPSGDEPEFVPADEPERIIESAISETEWSIEEVTDDSNLFVADDSTISISEDRSEYVVEWLENGCRYSTRQDTAVLVASIMRSSPDGFNVDDTGDRWQDYGVKSHQETEDAGISESGVLEILSGSLGTGVDDVVQNAFDVSEICTEDELGYRDRYTDNELERLNDQSGHGNNFSE